MKTLIFKFNSSKEANLFLKAVEVATEKSKSTCSYLVVNEREVSVTPDAPFLACFNYGWLIGLATGINWAVGGDMAVVQRSYPFHPSEGSD